MIILNFDYYFFFGNSIFYTILTEPTNVLNYIEVSTIILYLTQIKNAYDLDKCKINHFKTSKYLKAHLKKINFYYFQNVLDSQVKEY